MNLNKSKLVATLASVLMLSASIVGLGGSAANAASTPYTQNFDSMTTYEGIDFDGNTTTLVSNQPVGVGFTSGQAIKLDNQGAAWAGTKFVLPETSSFISTANATGSISVYSPDSENRCFVLKLEGPGVGIEKKLTVTQGWQTLDFSYAAEYNSSKNYNVAALMPDFFGVNCNMVWDQAKPLTTWYVDNLSFPGARDASEVVVVVPRTTPSLLVNFEGNDSSGYAITNFGGNSTAVVSDAPAGGSVGSFSALKVTTAGEGWAGTTFIEKSIKASLISAGNMVVKANIYSPVAGAAIMMKIESVEHPSQVVEVTQTSVLGWKTYSFDFTVGGNISALDYPKASIFFDFFGAKTSNPWFIDDIAFNGATGAALSSGGSGGGGGGTTDPNSAPFVVTFESNDTSGAALGGAADFGNNVSSVVTSNVGANTSKVGRIVNGDQCWSGTTFMIKDLGNQLISSTSKIVTLDLYSVVAIADVKLKLEGNGGDPSREVDVAHPGGGWQSLSFDFATGSAFAAGNYIKASLFVGFCGTAHPTEVLFDNVSFPGATKLPVVIPQITTRVNGLTSGNSVAGSTEGWAQYYAAGLQYFERGLEVGSTTNLTYTVTANGAPYANKTVHLLLGKEYSGSSAKVSVNGQAFTGGQVTVDLTTDANGVVSFSVVNTDVSADADPYQAANLLHPATGKHLFAQLALVGEKGNQDVLDILDLVYYRSAAATPPTVLNVRLADWNATNSFDGTHVWGDGGLGSWFDANTGYFAHYVKAGSTFNLKYSVKTATGVNAPNGTVVNLALGAAWSGSNAKFTVNGVAVSGLPAWGANGQLNQATTSATVSGGFITVSVTSLDLDEDATPNPGSATANPDGLNPLFMQVKALAEGNFVTHNDWVNIVVTQAAAAPTITSISGTSGKNGQAIDIVGTNLGDALSSPAVSLYTAATSKLPAVTTAVSVISVSADGTRMTIRSPNKTQKGNLRVTTGGGTATSATLFSASTSMTSKPAITFAASLVKEIGSTLTLTGANLGSAGVVKIGTVSVAFTVLSATSVSVVIPEGVVSGSTISATNAGGTVTTTKLIFQSPVVTTATASGRVGTTVTVTGTNLKATAISFGGNKTAKAVINTPNTLTFVVPTGALTGAIKITTGGGVVYTNSFTVVPPTPTVTSFTPATGKKGVAIVTVKGKYLTGATVTVGSVAVTLSAGATDTSFKFVIPAGASTGKINVTTAGGTVISATNLTVTN